MRRERKSNFSIGVSEIHKKKIKNKNKNKTKKN